VYGKSPGYRRPITWLKDIQINIILKQNSSDSSTGVKGVLNPCHKNYIDKRFMINAE
jgi:hypothetical protein